MPAASEDCISHVLSVSRLLRIEHGRARSVEITYHDGGEKAGQMGESGRGEDLGQADRSLC